ncbi:hypothetical protein [Chromobacterium haemolyticum]|uniref:hypothetical protein n=1 Tax=Chromobacterium TaxID=535 RepID=UPI004056D342
MRAIGIRAAPKAVTFAVYDDTLKAVINIEDIKIPIAFTVPDSLKYVRNNLLDILREYEVERAGVRITEPNAQSPSHERIQLEGVIQEAFASSSVCAYYVGQISSISARLQIDRADFKRYIDGTLEWDIERWGDMSNAQREAVLCAIGACHA